MRILFASGVDVGGAPKSTVELARLLAQRGHEVAVVMGDANPRGRMHPVLMKLAIKVRERTGWVWPRKLFLPFGRLPDPRTDSGPVKVWRTIYPAHALPHLLRSFQPDVVVANSFWREPMRWIRADTETRGVPLALYMREEHSLTHLLVSGLAFDLVLANSQHLASQAEAAGYRSHFIPSIVDLSAVQVESTRHTLCLINPVPENRPEILKALAARRPDIPVVLQSSWPLTPDWQQELASWASEIPNLELRARREHPADVYGDVRLLVATYPSGRPRVVLEAQYSGIPVVATDQPALAEIIGRGGLLVPLDADDEEWVKALERAWDDRAGYGVMSDAAHEHARRPEVTPAEILTRLEEALEGVGS